MLVEVIIQNNNIYSFKNKGVTEKGSMFSQLILDKVRPVTLCPGLLSLSGLVLFMAQKNVRNKNELYSNQMLS